MNDADQAYMREALDLAHQAEIEGEVPVGALIVIDNAVVGRGFNRPIKSSDPTAHAEIQAIRQATTTVGNYRLEGATLYVTMEPCAMCAGALVHARVRRLVYGCADERGGAAGSVFDIADSPRLNHRIEVTGGVLADECRELLQAFFRARR